MEQISVEKRLQISFEDDNKETNSAKRMKPGSVTGKSVVVLRHSDVTVGKSSVLMPNTIEMAQIKKALKGQFKRNIQFSSEMTELDVKRALIENFPILGRERFCCAAASDNRTRLEFHGERRIWDGRSIRRKIKGNSALYILIEENHQQSECPPTESELSLLGLGNIDTAELSAQSISDTAKEEMHGRHSVHHAPQSGAEKQAVHGNPLKELTRYPVVESGPASKTEEKNSDNLKPTQGQFMRHATVNKFPPPQHFVLVASQRGMQPSVHHPSISTNPSMTNARGVVTMATSSLPQSLPMGAIMVPGGGIGVAQPGVIASNAVSSASMVAHPGLVGGKAVSSASDHQSLGKTVFHVSNGQGAWHAGLPLVPQMNILPQMLTPQINTQIITSATTQQFQKQGIAAEKSAGMRDQDTQTEAAGTCQQALAPPRTALQPSGKSYPVEYLKETLAQEGARFKLPADQSRQSHDEKTNTSLVMTKGAGLNTAEEGRHPHSSTVSSDYESQGSDITDSGIETTGNIGGNRHALDLLCNAAIKMIGADPEKKSITKEICTKESSIGSISTFPMEKSIIEEICPKESSIRGGDIFVLILKEHLPSDTDEGYYARFGSSAPVVLTKLNQINLKGTIPASHSPGVVNVEVVSSTGSYLGHTIFTYIDVVDDILKKLVHDQDLHRRFFHLMAQELRNALRKPEGRQPLPAIPGFKTPEDKTNRDFVANGYKADDEASDDGELPCGKEDTKEKVDEGSDYEADDEGSDDGEDLCRKVADWNSNSKMFSQNDVSKPTDHRGDIAQPYGPTSGESVYEKFRNISDEQQADIEANLHISPERLLNSQDLSNLTHFSFTAQESGPRISEVEPSAFSSKDSDKVAGEARGNSGTARYNSEAPEKTKNPENMNIVDNRLNVVDFDQNSAADKTRRADERSGDEEDDSPGNPL